MARGKFDNGKWEPWFAWRPVRLLGGFRFAWLRRISRRYVLTDQNTLKIDYSDSPADHPAGYGLRKHDLQPIPSTPAAGPGKDYRGYTLEQKTMIAGWQVTITKNDAFVRHSSVSASASTAMAEARAYVDKLSA